MRISDWSSDVCSSDLNIIVIVDVTNGRNLREIKIPGVEYYNYLALSADGKSLLISGLVDTHSDLCLTNLETEQVEQLTDDAYSEIQPAWAPDGNRLVFATDRGPDTDLNALKFGSYKLAVMEVASRNIEVLEFFPGANNLNPQFSSDGQSLYFLSNADGMRNLFQSRFEDGTVAKLTKYFTGISGITENAPAMSVSRTTEDISYVLFKGGNYYIYKALLSDFERFPVNPDEVDFSASSLPPVEGIPNRDRKSVVQGKSVSVRVEPGV